MLALDLADYMPIAGWAHAIYHSVPIDGHTVQGLKLQVDGTEYDRFSLRTLQKLEDTLNRFMIG